MDARRRGIGTIVSVMRATAPIVSGRLRSSLRADSRPRTLSVSFNTPYAARVNKVSVRNKRYIERGAREGVRRANRLMKGQPVWFKWKRQVYTNRRGRIETRFAILKARGAR